MSAERGVDHYHGISDGMPSQLTSGLTPEEYLAFERRSPERHEYVDGELFAMSGASERHNQIVVKSWP